MRDPHHGERRLARRSCARSTPKVRAEPVDASFRLVDDVSVVVPDQWGRQLDTLGATAAIAAALRQPDRGAVVLPTKVVKPAVTQRLLPPALVVDRSLHHVTLFDKHGKAVRTLGVAVGQSQYPTPARALRDHREAAQPLVVPAELGLGGGPRSPLPSGPGDPLGTRWMGISRRASACTAHLTRPRRLQRVARLHPHAHPGRRVAVRARARRQPRVDHPLGAGRPGPRPGMTDHPCCETRALSLGARAAARARRAVRLAARPSRRQRVPRRAARGPSPQAPPSRCHGSTARARLVEGARGTRCGAQLLGLVVPALCRRGARPERTVGALRLARRALRRRRLQRRGGRGARIREATRRAVRAGARYAWRSSGVRGQRAARRRT